MAEFTVGVSIDRPINEVWDYTANFDNAPHWIKEIVAMSKLTPGPAGVGSKFKEVRRMAGMTSEVQLELTEWAPPNSLNVKVAAKGMSGSARITFKPGKEGGTHVTQIMAVQFSGFMKLVGPMAMGTMKKGEQSAYNKLKEVLESRSKQ